MASVINFKFRSALAYDSVKFDGAFVSVGELRGLIAEKKGLGQDLGAELVLSDPRTKSEYTDSAQLIPKSSAVYVRRTPLARQQQQQQQQQQAAAPSSSSAPGTGSQAPAGAPRPRPTGTYTTDEFGGELLKRQGGARPTGDSAEDRALAAALDSGQAEWAPAGGQASRGRGRGSGRGRGGPREAPPAHYRCHQCQQPGHWIDQCPTLDDPDFKVIYRPTGIPTSKMRPVEDGSLLLADGTMGFMAPNEAEFAEEMAPILAPAPSSSPTKPEPLPAAASQPLALSPAPSQPKSPSVGRSPLLALPAPPAKASPPVLPLPPTARPLPSAAASEPQLAGDMPLFAGNPAPLRLPPTSQLPRLPMPGMRNPLQQPSRPEPASGAPGGGPSLDAPLGRAEFLRLQAEMRRHASAAGRVRPRSRSRSPPSRGISPNSRYLARRGRPVRPSHSPSPVRYRSGRRPSASPEARLLRKRRSRSSSPGPASRRRRTSHSPVSPAKRQRSGSRSPGPQQLPPPRSRWQPKEGRSSGSEHRSLSPAPAPARRHPEAALSLPRRFQAQAQSQAEPELLGDAAAPAVRAAPFVPRGRGHFAPRGPQFDLSALINGRRGRPGANGQVPGAIPQGDRWEAPQEGSRERSVPAGKAKAGAVQPPVVQLSHTTEAVQQEPARPTRDAETMNAGGVGTSPASAFAQEPGPLPKKFSVPMPLSAMAFPPKDKDRKGKKHKKDKKHKEQKAKKESKAERKLRKAGAAEASLLPESSSDDAPSKHSIEPEAEAALLKRAKLGLKQHGAR